MAEVYAEASALRQEMEAEGLTDTELDATPLIITLIVNAIVMAALVPLAVFAVWPSIPAWIIPRHFWKKAEDEMFSGTFLIALNALLIFPVLGLITFLITWAKASLLAAVIYVALFPALCLFEWAYYGWNSCAGSMPGGWTSQASWHPSGRNARNCIKTLTRY